MPVKPDDTKAKDRWAFRVEPDADKLVRRAAALSHSSLTAFVLRAALLEAERVVADRTLFVLESAEWQAFTEALDRPVQRKPALEKLLAEPSVFE
jgi:uncharacterized protein (DUF1778 family)